MTEPSFSVSQVNSAIVNDDKTRTGLDLGNADHHPVQTKKYSAREIAAILGALNGKLQAQPAVGLCYFGACVPAKPAPSVGRIITGTVCGSSNRSGGRI